MMIIERFRTTVKRGHSFEVAEILKGNPAFKRIGITFGGENGIVHADAEYDDMNAYAEAINTRLKPETQAGLAESGWWEIATKVETEIIVVVE